MFRLSVRRVVILGIIGGLLLCSVRAEDVPVPTPLPAVLDLAVGVVDVSSLPNFLVARPAALEPSYGYVLMLDGPMTAEREAILAGTGITLNGYLPNNAYLVNLSATDFDALAALDFVIWLGRWQVNWKLDPTIGQRLQPFTTNERLAVQARGELNLIVTLFHGANSAGAMRDLTALGASVMESYEVAGQSLVNMTLPVGLLANVAQLDAVQFVEEAPELTFRNNSNRWIVQSNTLNVYPLYQRGLHGEGQIVGLLDGKLAHNHCSFYDNQPFGDQHRKIQAYNTSTGYDQHGTHTSGTVVGDAGVDDNTRGIAYLGKICYNTIPSFSETAIKSRLQLHHNQGARMHTNSWGDDGTTQYNSLCRGIDDFSYTNEDSLVFFAVSNQSTLRNPENAKNLVAVGASRDTPQQDYHCSGGRGPTSDGRRKPEVYAPGCGTVSSSGTSCGTASLSGTSMASPAVAAAGMLVRQYYTEGFYPTGAPRGADRFTPSAALVKATLLNASVDMIGISGYPSDSEGWGRVWADRALYFQGDARTLIVFDTRNADGLTTGVIRTEPFQVIGTSEQLRVTLVWTEPAASSGANPAYINDLDLEVLRPDGTKYLGNYFVSGESAPGGVKDGKNNVEQVHVSNPALGPWTARVVGATVAQGPQGYAIVITGQVIPGEVADPTCDDIRKLTARCKPGGTIKGKVRMKTAVFNGYELRLLIDGVAELSAVVIGDTAVYSTCCSTAGDHTVALSRPAGCDTLTRTATCP